MVTWKPAPETPDLRSSSLTLPGLPWELRAPKKLSQAVRRVSAGVFLGQGGSRGWGRGGAPCLPPPFSPSLSLINPTSHQWNAEHRSPRRLQR